MIKGIRAAGYTQDQMATYLGVGRVSLWRWERGTHAPMMPEVRDVLFAWYDELARQQLSSS